MSLLSRLLARIWITGSGPRAAALPVLTLPEGPLYAVGDSHGHAKRYAALEALIRTDARARGEDTARIVLLGDYVDRGPDSAGLLDLLCTPAPPGLTRHCLKGNHEVMFEAFLDAPDLRSAWLDFGGDETLASYGLYRDQLKNAPRHAAQMVQAMIPEAHRDFLANLPCAYATQTHFFCHAGVDPARPLTAQTEQDLLWIRAPFLDHDKPLEKVIVHGHSPVAAPDLRGWRINVDTGAYRGGALSAVRLDGLAPPIVLQVE